MEEEIIFYGHPNIRAMHEKTIELTKAKDITLRGDCIIGVNANKACIDLSNTIKNNSNVTLAISGLHPTALPERTLKESQADYVIIGEGPLTIKMIAEYENNLIEKKDILSVLHYENRKIVRTKKITVAT